MHTGPLYGQKGYGKLTQSAGTVITRLIEPRKNAFTRLTSVWYTCSTTAHTLTVLRPLGVTTFTAAAAAAQAVVNITADPGDYSSSRTSDNAIAASDFVVYEVADGTFVLDTVSSVSSLAITLTSNVPTTGTLVGGKFWFFGTITDTNPNDATAHPQFTLPASTTTYLDETNGFVGTIPGNTNISGLNGRYEPMIVHSGNATAAGVIERVVAMYSKN